MDFQEVASDIMQDVVDLEHINCTSDDEMCHVTRNELSNILYRRLIEEPTARDIGYAEGALRAHFESAQEIHRLTAECARLRWMIRVAWRFWAAVSRGRMMPPQVPVVEVLHKDWILIEAMFLGKSEARYTESRQEAAESLQRMRADHD